MSQHLSINQSIGSNRVHAFRVVHYLIH